MELVLVFGACTRFGLWLFLGWWSLQLGSRLAAFACWLCATNALILGLFAAHGHAWPLGNLLATPILALLVFSLVNYSRDRA